MAVTSPVRLAFPAMGTTVSVLSVGPLPPGAAGAVRELFIEWEAELSRFLPDSDLSRVNRGAGRPIATGDRCRTVVREALRAAEATAGVFDPTLGATMDRIGYRGAPGPSMRLPAGLRHAASWGRVRVDDAAGTIAVPPGAMLDLGGIAKGMAVDAAAALLNETGTEAALVNAGGDLAVAGTGVDWPVALTEASGRVVCVRSGALATSSISQRAWIHRGARRHHLIDPSSGEPARSGLYSVTTAAAACAQAEVAAKCAFILGRDDGTAFLERLGIPGLLTDLDGRSHPTRQWLGAVIA